MVRFEWDAKKDQRNQSKHGISFGLAQQAFLDPNRVIAKDLKHSGKAQRKSTAVFLHWPGR